MNFVRKHALDLHAAQRLRHRDCGAARLQQCRRAPTARTSTSSSTAAAGTTRTSSPRPSRAASASPMAASGKPVAQAALLKTVLAGVDLAYQNLDSVELGVTTVDHYLRQLGGMGRPSSAPRAAPCPIYIGDQTRGEGKVRSLSEQVALETRTRMLNPKWYEGMLKHGYEGVRADRGARHQHHRLVGDDRPGRALGLRADHPDLRPRSRNARAPGGAQPRRFRQGREPADRGP